MAVTFRHTMYEKRKRWLQASYTFNVEHRGANLI
jgi:hypothetical protein